MKRPKLYLIDATAFCYRAFYAVRGLSTSFGQQTGAIFGFVNILNKIIKEHAPEYLAICFDVSRETFRTKKFQEYKIQRPPMPDDLSSQLPYIRQIIEAYKFPIFEQEGFEADDVIATLAKKARHAGAEVVIVSADKDILQLVSDGVTVLSPHKEADILYTEKEVKEQFGVEPKHIIDIIGLAGDSVDNIPGAKGIGEKTATELISQFGSVDKLLAHPDKIEREKLRQLVKDNSEQIKMSRDLAVLHSDVPLEFDLKTLALKTPDYNELFKIFKHLEFKSFLKALPVETKEEVKLAVTDLDDDQLKSHIKAKVVFVACAKDDAGGCEIFISDDGEHIFRCKSLGKGLQAILSDTSVIKTAFNCKDLRIILHKHGVAMFGPYQDVMIEAGIINPSHAGMNIAELALEYLGESLGEVGAAHELSLVSRLVPKLSALLEEKGLAKLYHDLEMPLIDVLAEVELNGVGLDVDFLKTLSRQTEKKLVTLIEKIYEVSGTQFNINSPKQLGDVLFNKLGLPVVKRTKTGPSTNEEVLVTLAKKHELPSVILEYRGLMKLKNTYIDTLPELRDPKDGKLHTSFNQIGAETGRLSSQEPNLQNIPVKTEIGRQIRKAIITSEKDGFLLSSDYSQIELRILAHLSRDKMLVAAFKEGRDIHRFTASLLYSTDEKSVTDEMRETAKRINFGIVYGQSSFGLAADMGISFDEARNFIDAYFVRYAGVKEYIDATIAQARKDGFVKTLLNRRRYIPQINEKSQGLRQFAERQAVNTPIQGSAADLIKLAMVAIQKELRERSLKTKMILQIHDELLFDVPRSEVKEALRLVREKMEHVLELSIPIKVSMKQGQNWLEMEDVS